VSYINFESSGYSDLLSIVEGNSDFMCREGNDREFLIQEIIDFFGLRNDCDSR